MQSNLILEKTDTSRTTTTITKEEDCFGNEAEMGKKLPPRLLCFFLWINYACNFSEIVDLKALIVCSTVTSSTFTVFFCAISVDTND